MTREEMLNECISRDRAIVQLNHLQSDWDDDWNIAIRKCIEAIKKLPSVTLQPKWILCKDRMPDYHQLVLTFDGEYICVEQRIPYIIDENGNKHIGSEWWVDVNYVTDSELYSGLRDGAAVAWMPLPIPPNMSEIPTVAEGSDKE